jgi:1,4-alpha-glucan branching enzyme
MQETHPQESSQAAARATLSRTDIDAIVRGEHRDPFAVLGPHTRHGGATADLVIRVFRPGASAMTVVRRDGRPPHPMASIHPAGLFEAIVPGQTEPLPYRLRCPDASGGASEFEDPYRFPSTLSDYDLHLMGEGAHHRNYEKLGAHLLVVDGVAGVCFAVWAPNARRVSVVGDFNGWDGRAHPMRLHPGNGLWEIFIPGLAAGSVYKFEILPKTGPPALKADPYAFGFELPPRTASVVTDLTHRWEDEAWMAARAGKQALDAPIAIYEVHPGSWRRTDGAEFLSYRELATQLAAYVTEIGYTHVELMPITEHPFYGSWGYQTLGMYAPTARYGTPEDFMAFVDILHQHGIGVILDWVPAHFPQDPHGLVYFDGTFLYEHEDPRLREHPDWGTRIYNFGRNEVANFLMGSALFWLDKYHIDGLRLDAVASMLYLDYGRKPGEWAPNRHGGNENLEAVAFLRRLNEVVYQSHPDVMTIAEESTSWPLVSRPLYLGGLGFGYKWNMGWMHDTLAYMSYDPIHRKHHHQNLTFGLLYAWHENFILPLSHDEVVYGKGSLQRKMPGDDWQKFANLRLYFAFMYGHPGKKHFFMGGEFGQINEWYHEASLDWHLLDMGPYHRGVQRLVQDLNRFYRTQPALHQLDFDPRGFQWVDCNDWEGSSIAFLRKARDPEDFVLFVCNFTPVLRADYRVGVPRPGFYRERLDTDAAVYGGSNVGNAGGCLAEDRSHHGQPYSLRLTLPPLAVLVLTPEGRA